MRILLRFLALLLLGRASAFGVGRPLLARGAAAGARGAAAGRRASALTADASGLEIVTFTDGALAQLHSLKEKQGMDTLQLRMGVRAGGCSGMSYVMDVLKPGEEADETDTIMDIEEGLKCVIDAKVGQLPASRT